MGDPVTQFCGKCRTRKPISEFVSGGRQHGLRTYCRQCAPGGSKASAKAKMDPAPGVAAGSSGSLPTDTGTTARKGFPGPVKDVNGKLVKAMNRGDLNAATEHLETLREMSMRPEYRSQRLVKSALVQAEARVELMKLVEQQEKKERKPEDSKCKFCGQAFARFADEPKRRACYICRPHDAKSVRTVSGGLPTHGKRRG